MIALDTGLRQRKSLQSVHVEVLGSDRWIIGRPALIAHLRSGGVNKY